AQFTFSPDTKVQQPLLGGFAFRRFGSKLIDTDRQSANREYRELFCGERFGVQNQNFPEMT
ncbi:hypothetical protein N9406_12150, partial [Verrucomicrobiales bacterium]|nr:hypothetical protein [Verrucomicrobiales bacterium]